ncbi:prepilin peptidase [Salmonella enterica]|nr:prepilin peptidase [Salmonella enterica]
MMVIYIVLLGVIIFAYVLSIVFPVIYLHEKKNAIKQSDQLLNENDEVGCFPVLGIVIFTIPLLIFILSGNIVLSSFCFILSVMAYTDLSARWIPDLAIYLLLAIAMLSLRTADLIISFWSVLFYLMPAILLSTYGYVLKKEKWIASGDYYVFPAIGLMITPEYAASLMLINLLIVLFFSRWVQKIPLVTVAYITFTGCQTCILLDFI